jgi:hypothetical protein
LLRRCRLLREQTFRALRSLSDCSLRLEHAELLRHPVRAMPSESLPTFLSPDAARSKNAPTPVSVL